MEKIKLNYSFENTVANVLLADGKGNVLDKVMMAEIMDVFNEIHQNKGIKLITFQGEGKHFSFGASVQEHTKEFAADMIHSFHNIFVKIIEMGVPTLAKISGQCLGGGLELALICNFIFADKSAVLGQPEIILGVFPPPASLILPLKIGQSMAEEMLLTGVAISAEKGKETGLINEIFDDKAAMEKAVNSWIEKNILPKSASSLKFAVKSARTHFNKILIENLPLLEDIYVNQLMETTDANEGIQSFLEKRRAVWQNC